MLLYLWCFSLPPSSVKVAKEYSLSVGPGSEWATTNKEYQVPGFKSTNSMTRCSGTTLFDRRIHSEGVLDLTLYWITKFLMKHPFSLQELRLILAAVELLLMKLWEFLGASGARDKRIEIPEEGHQKERKQMSKTRYTWRDKEKRSRKENKRKRHQCQKRSSKHNRLSCWKDMQRLWQKLWETKRVACKGDDSAGSQGDVR